MDNGKEVDAIDTKEKVWSALEGVLDPEIGINIVDLGLVYELNVENRRADITMTLTVPECPLQDDIVREVKEKVGALPEIDEVDVRLVWEPKWTPARMNDAAIEEFRRLRSLV